MAWDDREDYYYTEERQDYEDTMFALGLGDEYDPDDDEAFYAYMQENGDDRASIDDEDKEDILESQAEYERQRHHTQAYFDAFSPRTVLLDFDVFKRANGGDPEAMEAVLQYLFTDSELSMIFRPPYSNKKMRQLWTDALKKSIMQYTIRDGDTYFSTMEISDRMDDIFDPYQDDTDDWEIDDWCDEDWNDEDW